MIRLLLVSLLVAASSCAVTSTDQSRSGAYVGASVIGAWSNFNEVVKEEEEADIDGGDLGGAIGLRAGYRFLDRFAVEVTYEDLYDFKVDDSEVEFRNVGLQGKFYPFTGVFQIYGLGGVGYMDSKVKDVDFDSTDPYFRLGAGTEIYLLNFLPVFFELDYTWPTQNVDGLQYASAHLGLMFRF